MQCLGKIDLKVGKSDLKSQDPLEGQDISQVFIVFIQLSWIGAVDGRNIMSFYGMHSFSRHIFYVTISALLKMQRY